MSFFAGEMRCGRESARIRACGTKMLKLSTPTEHNRKRESVQTATGSSSDPPRSRLSLHCCVGVHQFPLVTAVSNHCRVVYCWRPLSLFACCGRCPSIPNRLDLFDCSKHVSIFLLVDRVNFKLPIFKNENPPLFCRENRA